MNSSPRSAITVVRLVAGAFFLVGVMNLALYWFKNHHDHTEGHLGRALYLSIPLLIGIGILVKGAALAEKLDEYLDGD